MNSRAYRFENPELFIHEISIQVREDFEYKNPFKDYNNLSVTRQLLSGDRRCPKMIDEDQEMNPWRMTAAQIQMEEFGLYRTNQITGELQCSEESLEAFKSELDEEFEIVKYLADTKREIEHYMTTKFAINFKENPTDYEMAIVAHSQYPQLKNKYEYE